MGELINKIKTGLAAVGRSTKVFSSANRIVLLGGLTAVSILLIVWARLGFTLDFSRFYAAPAPSVLTVQCGATQNILTWTLSPDRNSNAVLRTRDGGSGTWVCGGPSVIAPCTDLDTRTFTDTDIQAGHVYQYVHKSGAESSSNAVTCSTIVSTPVPTPTPIPTQTVIPTTTVSPIPTPTQTSGPTPTPTPSPLAAAVLVASGANTSDMAGGYASTVTATNNQQISVQAALRNGSTSTTLQNVVVRAALPSGLVYVSGSTVIDGVSASVDSIAAGGVSIGSLTPGQIMTITFRARVDSTSFAVGQTQTSLIIQVNTSNAPTASGEVIVVVNRTASTGTAGTVQTGPGDATVAALLISAVMTLLYVSYTHTSVFRRREVDAISHSKDPMDFRS